MTSNKWKPLSCVWFFAIPWAIQSMEFFRPEYFFPFSRGSSQPRDWTQVSPIAGRFFTRRATRESHLLEITYGANKKLGLKSAANSMINFHLLSNKCLLSQGLSRMLYSYLVTQPSFCLTKSKALVYLWDFKSKQASPELTWSERDWEMHGQYR